jgi:hypothetical protein
MRVFMGTTVRHADNYTTVFNRQPEVPSEASELIALRLENRELRTLVVHLTSLVIRKVADRR